MSLGAVFQVALAFGAFNVSLTHGFVNRPSTPPLVRATTVCSMIGQGWDNANFLDSLSGGPDAMDAANQKYLAHGEQRGKLQEWRRKQQARDEIRASGGDEGGEAAPSAEEEGQGGSRFKELMEKTQQAQTRSPSSSLDGPSGPITYNPLEGIKSTSSEMAPDAASDIDLTMEEQAKLFQKFMKMQQGGGEVAPAQQQTQPGGKRAGRNRDADTIANTADLYFAQLKRDSTVRTIARFQGDEEKANAVFADEGVTELEGMVATNPYLKE